ncbi:ferrochelatase [Haloglycomyces albus]|uniref:ferrochelatase n=1 Tax=Haloglycomyces albus TaxID=526067 RepID=UPI00046D9114|nr:ferrochelatase [Haloglycomyces albus]
MQNYDAILLLSFGGPEGPDDVLPFLRNVTRGRGIPDERLAEVAEHYRHFNGVSPLNQWCRDLIPRLRDSLRRFDIHLPVYWGNRNWNPMLVDTVAQMANDGVRHALAIATSAYGSYSSCRQYLDDISAARAAVGERAPQIDKVRHFFDHPGFIEGYLPGIEKALNSITVDDTTRLVFTAHSIPQSMEEYSGPEGARYSDQVTEAGQLVVDALGWKGPWDVVWQSRSGPPSVPWLEPDVNDRLEELDTTTSVVVCPIGFLSDHIEVLWDLDNEAADTARRKGIEYARAATPDIDGPLSDTLAELAAERIQGAPLRRLGKLPLWDPREEGCCPARQAPPRPKTE